MSSLKVLTVGMLTQEAYSDVYQEEVTSTWRGRRAQRAKINTVGFKRFSAVIPETENLSSPLAIQLVRNPISKSMITSQTKVRA